MNHEPVVNTAFVGAVVVAAIALLVAFGAPISEEQQTAIVGLVGVVAPVVIALFQRREVTPVEDHDPNRRANQ